MLNFFEQPWTLLTIAGGGMVFLLIGRSLRPGRWQWWQWLVPFVIAAAGLSMDYLVRTEREKVEAVIDTALKAARQEDPNAIEQLISESYHDSYHNTKKVLMRYCRRWLSQPLIEKNYKTILEEEISPPQAAVVTSVRIVFDERSFVAQTLRSTMIAKIKFSLTKEQNRWLIERIEILQLNGRVTRWKDINSAVW